MDTALVTPDHQRFVHKNTATRINLVLLLHRATCIKLYDDAEFDKFFPMFQVSPEGVVTRDEKVFRFAKDQNIPLLMLTSGEILLTQVCGPFL